MTGLFNYLNYFFSIFERMWVRFSEKMTPFLPSNFGLSALAGCASFFAAAKEAISGRLAGRVVNNNAMQRGVESEREISQRIVIDSLFEREIGKERFEYADGAYYQGDVLNGKSHGRGIFHFANGDYYRGDFFDGRMHGRGVYYAFRSKLFYEGFLHNGKQTGEGSYSFDQGRALEGVWVNNAFVSKETSGCVEHPIFLSSLLNKTVFPSELSSIQIISSYFKKNRRYPHIAEALSSLLSIHSSRSIDGPTNQIYEDLARNQSRLLLFSIPSTDSEPGHAMLVNVVPIYQKKLKDGEIGFKAKKETKIDPSASSDEIEDAFIIFKIYNSGRGLNQYHDSDPVTGRYQTALQIQVPKASIDQRIIAKLLTCRFGSLEEAYEYLLRLPGAKKLSCPQPVWQRPQKGANCAIEFVFAYLKNELGEEEYHKMRLQLFEDCMRAVRKSKDLQDLAFLPKLEGKKRRRLERGKGKLSDTRLSYCIIA